MRIELQNVSRHFNYQPVFSKVNYEFEIGKSYAITGPNGSGKSTLLQIISGFLSPSTGKVLFFNNNKAVDVEGTHSFFSIAAPYLELIEEMTLKEMIKFHNGFQRFVGDLKQRQIINQLNINGNKRIRDFSSGMKQRTKLMLAMLSDVPVILLDEPCSNLDEQGKKWYREIVRKYAQNRLLIIASTQTVEYEFCDRIINMLDYKEGESRKVKM